jgi:hypothetical protein
MPSEAEKVPPGAEGKVANACCASVTPRCWPLTAKGRLRPTYWRNVDSDLGNEVEEGVRANLNGNGA